YHSTVKFIFGLRLSHLRHLNHAGEIWTPEGSRSVSDVGASSLKGYLLSHD
ncbi:hypothetical protein PC111_g19571, partial [Phytophthora cactorum]